jgi:hypothetical protein
MLKINKGGYLQEHDECLLDLKILGPIHKLRLSPLGFSPPMSIVELNLVKGNQP